MYARGPAQNKPECTANKLCGFYSEELAAQLWDAGVSSPVVMEHCPNFVPDFTRPSRGRVWLMDQTDGAITTSQWSPAVQAGCERPGFVHDRRIIHTWLFPTPAGQNFKKSRIFARARKIRPIPGYHQHRITDLKGFSCVGYSLVRFTCCRGSNGVSCNIAELGSKASRPRRVAGRQPSRTTPPPSRRYRCGGRSADPALQIPSRRAGA